MNAQLKKPTTPSVALVTGSSRGIGRSIALALADRGTDVIVTFHSAEGEARKVVEEITARWRRATALRLDVGDSKSFDAFATRVRSTLTDTFGAERLDFLVNNAGVGGYAPFAQVTEESFDALVDVHFKGPFFLSQKLLPLLADGGRIVNLSSGLARYSMAGLSVYSSVKAAIEALTRVMAIELGPRNITVNVVAPGGVVTDFGGGVMRDPGLQKTVIAETPLGRLAEPDDIAGVVAVLLAPETRWVTGQRVEVTGGYRL